MNLIRQHPYGVGVIITPIIGLGFAKIVRGSPWYFHQLSTIRLGNTLLNLKTDSHENKNLITLIDRKIMLIKCIDYLSNRGKIFFLPTLIGVVVANLLSQNT